MNEARSTSLCAICGAEFCGDGTVCQQCQRAFDQNPGRITASDASPLDLEKYSSRMFPWEQVANPPRLISVHSFFWLVLALGLVVVVLLLALIRTPLPSCWELS